MNPLTESAKTASTSWSLGTWEIRTLETLPPAFRLFRLRV